MSGAAADIRRAEPLRHNALAAELAGVAVDDVAAVPAVEFEQVEGIREHAFIGAPVANALEHRQAAPVAGDGLAVDEAGPRLEPRRGFQDRREAPGPVLPVPGRRWTKTANGDPRG